MCANVRSKLGRQWGWFRPQGLSLALAAPWLSLFLAIYIVFASLPQTGFAADYCAPSAERISYLQNDQTASPWLIEAGMRLIEDIAPQLPGAYCLDIETRSMDSETQQLEALLRQEYDIVIVSISTLAIYLPELRAFSQPYRFQSSAEAVSLLESNIGQDALNGLTNIGLVGLGYWVEGFENISSYKPIREPQDLSELVLISNDNPDDLHIAEILNVSTIHRNLATAFNDLQLGRGDGFIGTWSELLHLNIFLAQEEIVETNHKLRAYVPLVNKLWYENLNDEDRRALRAALFDTSHFMNATSSKDNLRDRTALKEKGATIYLPTDEQNALWRQILTP